MTEKFKTDVGMLPQLGPLEGQAVDNPRGWDETGLTETPLGNRSEESGSIEPVTSSVWRLSAASLFLIVAARP